MIAKFNSPTVLLQAGFVQSLGCCDLTLKYVSRFQSMFKELNVLTWAVCTLNLPSSNARKKLISILQVKQYFNFRSGLQNKVSSRLSL